MDHSDHVALIMDGVAGLEHGAWADIGSGTGAFTLALADLLGDGGWIVSVDRDAGALREQAQRLARSFPEVPVVQHRADFTRPVELGTLDGIVMANALHFATDHEAVVRSLARSLRPDGRFIIVEYDADTGNRWVPHPISLAGWRELAGRLGLRDSRELHRVPSRFLGSIYAAMAVR